nr:ATP-binding cassette domain-containing protein [Streptomyces bobili]
MRRATAARRSIPSRGRGARHVSFEVPAGRTVAFVGPTGSGKPTIVTLALGVRRGSGSTRPGRGDERRGRGHRGAAPACPRPGLHRTLDGRHRASTL